MESDPSPITGAPGGGGGSIVSPGKISRGGGGMPPAFGNPKAPKCRTHTLKSEPVLRSEAAHQRLPRTPEHCGVLEERAEKWCKRAIRC